MEQSQHNKNQTQALDEKFQKMERLIESFMTTVYQWDSMDPLEVALFLNILAGKQLDSALEIHMNLKPDQIQAIAKQQVDRYNKTGSLDRDTFVGELIGLQSAYGVRLMKMNTLVNELLQSLNRDTITAEDLDDGGPM